MDDLVLLRTFSDVLRAEELSLQLEREGIDVFLLGSPARRLYLFVLASQEVDARRLLRARRKEAA
jgi:hypothetical protein